MPRVSVVIPTINESGTIEELIEALQEHQEIYARAVQEYL